MSIHTKTREILTSNSEKFSEEISKSISTILYLIDNFSAISDANYLLYKNEKTIPGIKLPSGEASWLPIRNLARILGNVAAQDYGGVIEKISLESMSCGCDYFEGTLSIETENEKINGAYKWQWTAFPDRERSYAQFTVFPKIKQTDLLEH